MYGKLCPDKKAPMISIMNEACLLDDTIVDFNDHTHYCSRNVI